MKRRKDSPKSPNGDTHGTTNESFEDVQKWPLGNYFQQLAFRVLGVKRRPAGLDLAVGTVCIPLPDGALGFHATWGWRR